MASELELKFSTSEAVPPDQDELQAALSRNGFQLGPGRLMNNRDRYFDDARLSLSRAGLVLRRRMSEGAMLATLKSRGSVNGALHERDELELPLVDGEWPKPILDRISTVTAPGLLTQHTIIDTRRHRHAVLKDGRAVATLAFDTVSARLPSGQSSVVFDEVEIEANGPSKPEVLEQIARAVEEVLPLVPCSSTKLERVRELLMLGGWNS